MAEAHGAQRRRLGYATGAVASEYPLFQDVILRLAQATGMELRPAEGILLARCMGAASAAALAQPGERMGLSGRGRERLGENEAWLRLIVDSIPSLISFIGADQRYLLGNSAYQAWFGVAPGTLRGRPMREVVGEENYARALPSIQRVLAGELVRLSGPVRFAGGRQGHVEGMYVPHFAPDGQVVGFVSLVQDVTERKRLEAELLRASDALEHGDPMFVLDHDFRFVLVNLGLERMARRPREEVLGRCLWETFPDTQRDPLAWREFHRARDEQVAVQFEVYSSELDLWVEVTAYPTQEGGIAVFHRDISERKRLAVEREALLVREQSAREQAERLAREEARLREFEQQLLGIVSHDLRNPLSAILVGTQLLQRRGGLDMQGTATVARIQHSAERGVRLVRDLLDLTQVRLGTGIQLSRSPLDLHALVRGVVQELRAVHPERQVRLSSEGSGEGVWDGDRLEQVVSNLVSNALKYSPDGTPVDVRTVEEEGSVVLQVHNTGEPIAPEHLSRIFEPMHRGTTQADAQGRSVGLGLFIVQQLVQAHGGTIDVRSTAKEGTTFTVRLPRSG